MGEASAALHALQIVEGDAYGTEPDASWASGVREVQIMLHLKSNFPCMNEKKTLLNMLNEGSAYV